MRPYQKGGCIRSIPWSKMLPHLLDVSVTRASLPSTVSRNVMSHAEIRPRVHCASRNRIKVATTKTALTAVTMLGVIAVGASRRVT